MSARRLPVGPNLTQLKYQARELREAIRRDDTDALATLRAHNPRVIEPSDVKLADAAGLPVQRGPRSEDPA